MSGLGRINLFVGTNNCGKTSVLEAINILVSQGRPEALWSALKNRGEDWFIDNSRILRRDRELDVCHLFNGHELDLGSTFEISGTRNHQKAKVSAEIVERDPNEDMAFPEENMSSRQTSLFDTGEDEREAGGDRGLALRLAWDGEPSYIQQFPLSLNGGVFANTRYRKPDNVPPSRLITTEAINGADVVSLFESIVLTPEEEIVIDTLKSIEPTIERIASISAFRRFSRFDRGGLVVKLRDHPKRIPIGSMGDGIWRLLGIALALVEVRGGTLLIDEIDTGLHYSVMQDMWRLVLTTSERLNVQVFATTHSRDCFESLSAISRSDVEAESRVSIQRIERGKNKAVAFSEQEIVIAAERSIEVR